MTRYTHSAGDILLSTRWVRNPADEFMALESRAKHMAAIGDYEASRTFTDQLRSLSAAVVEAGAWRRAGVVS